jgi:primosomal protein DnaI
MKTAELLIIDDLGNEKITDWSRDAVLYDVLDYRLRNKKNKIIINSNYNLSELKELYKVDNEVRAKRFINLINSICESIELLGVNRFL